MRNMEMGSVYKLERVQCSLCSPLPAHNLRSSLPIPPVYHCPDDDLVCVICSQVHAQVDICLCPLEACPLETSICDISTTLLSSMGVICPNGCNEVFSIEDFKMDIHNCPKSMCTCPFYSCGVDFPLDIQSLKFHLEYHNPIIVPLKQSAEITINHGDKLLLKEKGSRNFFFLSFKDSCLVLSHMWWDESRSHSLIVKDLGDGSSDDWFLYGHTSDIRSNSPVQCLKLPLSFLDGQAITCEVVLGRESDAQRRTVAVLKNLVPLECISCRKLVTPPVFHCHNNHQICYTCVNKLPKEELGRRRRQRRCTKCSERVMRCRTSSYILSNTEYQCSNRNMGCEYMMRIGDYEHHVERCLKSRYYCPICSGGFDVLDSLRAHLSSHPKKKLKPCEEKSLTVGRGLYLLQMKSTDEYYLLIFKENHICLQHMYLAKEQEYYIKFQDGGCEWHFGGETTEVWKIPMLSPCHLTIPETVLHPQSTLPIPILVQILP